MTGGAGSPLRHLSGEECVRDSDKQHILRSEENLDKEKAKRLIPILKSFRLTIQSNKLGSAQTASPNR
jgi:hypothetical protein